MSAATAEQTESMITQMLGGQMEHADIALYLSGLADKGETVEDIVGAARALRRHVTGFIAPDNAIDCCGTGGDGCHTLNISTATAFVVAACGVPVAKHGNRAASSKCGAADVLEYLGVNLDVPLDKLEDTLAKIGFCFLMAPLHHRAMANVAPVRKAMGRRTIFNLIGPLANPAHVKRQMIGVYSPSLVRPMAEALKKLGSKGAWVVHGDGMDEIALTGSTHVAMLAPDGTITEQTLRPNDFGLSFIQRHDIAGEDAAYNAAALMAILEGQQGAYRDIVLANAAAVLVMAGQAEDLKQGMNKSSETIDNKEALKIFKNYRDAVA